MATTTTRKSTKSIDAVADAHALLASDKAAHEAAVLHAEELRSRLSSGDRDVTSSDLRDADSEIERMALLVQASERALARAKNAAPNYDDSLAVALLDAVTEALGGVPVTIATSRPEKAPVNVPAAVLVQRRPSKRDTISGTISGALEVLYFRSPLHRELDSDRLEKVAHTHKARLDTIPGGEREQDGAVVDSVTVKIASAWEAQPVILSQPGDEWRVLNFGRNLGEDIKESFPYSGSGSVGVRIGNGWAGHPESPVNVNPKVGETRVVTDVTSGGVRRRTVECVVNVGPGRTCPWQPDEIVRKAGQAIEDQAGNVCSGLGRIEDARVTGTIPVGTKMRELTARFTFVSRAA